MAITRPTGEQLIFNSAKTGTHVLDDYLEAAELGNRSLQDLLLDVFKPDGSLKPDIVQFRVDSTRALQVRLGDHLDPNEGWIDVGVRFFTARGQWASGASYNDLDIVSDAAGDIWYCITAHTAGSNLDIAKFQKISDQNPAKLWAMKEPGQTVDGTYYSAKHYALQAMSFSGFPTTTNHKDGVLHVNKNTMVIEWDDKIYRRSKMAYLNSLLKLGL